MDNAAPTLVTAAQKIRSLPGRRPHVRVDCQIGLDLFRSTKEKFAMGIVVTVFMLLGLLLVSPWLPNRLRFLRDNSALTGALGAGLFAAGLWNALWHGLRHLGDFWGLAALVSGTLMVGVAVVALEERSQFGASRIGWLSRSYRAIRPLSLPISVGLLACFLLYATTLVRLNLGYSIIGQ